MVITADDFAPAQTGAFSLATDHRELLLFIFTFFTTFIKQRVVCIIQINSFKRIIM